MYELANQIRIKDLAVLRTECCMNMIESYIETAFKSGVDIGELAVNIYVYESEDPIFLVEYVKMLCNLSKVFRDILDNSLYTLRLYKIVNESVYNINFHNIFNEVNTKFNTFIDEQFLFDEFGIYHSEISLETSIAMYEVFNDSVILSLKEFVDPNLLKFIFNKHSVKYLQKIYEEIFNQLENVFLIY